MKADYFNKFWNIKVGREVNQEELDEIIKKSYDIQEKIAIRLIEKNNSEGYGKNKMV